MDELAGKLGMDPLDLRLANYAETNQSRGMPYTAKHLRESYSRGAEAIGWRERPRGGPGPRKRGVGMASQVWGGGGAPPSYSIMRVNADGTFDLMIGTHDLGTGTKTVMTQVAAEELGVAEGRIRVTIGDTLACPYSLLSAGSLTVPSVSPSVRMAASEVKRQLLDLAGSMLSVDPQELSIRDDHVVSAQTGETRLSVVDVAAKAGNYMIIGKGARGPNPRDRSVNTFGAQFVEVEVDTGTGMVRVLRVVAAHEFGRVLNPLTLSSQVEGGVFQGAGYATLEERVIDPRTGRVVNANLSDYRLPTAMDVPEVTALFTGPPDTAANNVGAKGAGEPPIIPTAAAVANAVFAATGVRIREIPITPARMLDALKGGNAG
jgi:xanthine dehydrogenase YagR molybdenum-binding subunit